MITFVLYDDVVEFRDKVEKVIRKLTKTYGIEAKIETYEKYDENFKKTVENSSVPKIYLLDIDVPESESGIDVAKKIRKNDWDSVIILLTGYSEMGYEALKAKIMVLDYICKYNDWKTNTIQTVLKAIRKLGTKKILVVESEGITHRIYTSDILYIVKESAERKCLIKTVDHEIYVNKALSEIGKDLDYRFYLSHRSCYINLEKITDVDWKHNYIYFGKGEMIDYLARDRKKGLKEYVRNN